MVKIDLDLRKHCIETATRRIYNHLLSEYFRTKGENVELEAKLELLQKALTTFDFSSLRGHNKTLAGNNDTRVVLMDDDRNLPMITINDRPIDLKPYVKKSR